MVKNILFDMGEVLIHFDTKYYISRLNLGTEDSDLLMQEVFRSVEWVRLDRGSMTDDEAVESICHRLPPRLHASVRELVSHWDMPILPVDGMEQLVRELKQKGHRIFLLSNASLRHHEYWPRIPGSQYFDDLLVSANVRLLKPQPEIYHLACETFHILPEETIFIDDVPANIEGASQAGINGYVFRQDIPALKNWLASQGILL